MYVTDIPRSGGGGDEDYSEVFEGEYAGGDEGVVAGPSGGEHGGEEIVGSATKDGTMPSEVNNDLNSLMTSSVKVVENGRHICLLCKYSTKPRKDWSFESFFTKQRASMHSHMRKNHMKVNQLVDREKNRCPSCDVLYSSQFMFYNHVCITCYNYAKRVHKENAFEYLKKFKQNHQQQRTIPVGISENAAKRIVASQSLSSFNLGDFLIVTNSDFDLTISDEPYIALMLLYNLKSGKYMTRIWNQTVEVGWAFKENELEQACWRLFKQGKPCIGYPTNQYDKNMQDFFQSHTPIPRIVSKSCRKLIGKSDRSDCLSCLECQKFDNLEVTGVGGNVMEDPIKTEEECGENIEVEKEVFEEDFSQNSIKPNESGKEIFNTEHTKEGDELTNNITQEVSATLATEKAENRPPFTYAQLIFQALMEDKDLVGLPLSNIYSFISKKYPFYKVEDEEWQNSIRHNLTLNEGFEKVPKLLSSSSQWRMKEGFKPPFTYAQLILQALMVENDLVGLPLSHIYSFISQKHPFYKMEDQGWQNSIRHVLSLNEGFEKVPNTRGKVRLGGNGSNWRMKEGFRDRILNRKGKVPRQESSKFQKIINVGSIFENSQCEEASWGKLKPVEGTDQHGQSEGKACLWCDKVIKSTSIWTKHRTFYHHYGLFQCPACPFKCHFAKEIFEHMSIEAHLEEVCCQNCQKHFPPAEIESHYVMCTTGCAACNKTFFASKGLKYHLMYAHKGEQGVNEEESKCCERCGKRFRNLRLMRLHIKNIHEHKPCLCSVCGKTFKNYMSVHNHKVKVHYAEENERQCQKCGLRFSNPSLLKSHLLSHEAPQFKCSFCDKMLKKKSNLEAHEMAHRGEKPFQCSLCPASFTRKKYLAQHMHGAHKIAGPKGGKVGWVHGKKQKQNDM